MPHDDDQLPDFIFVRYPNLEQEAGFRLAGAIYTDIPWSHTPQPPGATEREMMKIIVEQVMNPAPRDPSPVQAGVWRNGRKPDHGLDPPFPQDLLQTRAERCVVIPFQIDANGRWLHNSISN